MRFQEPDSRATRGCARPQPRRQACPPAARVRPRRGLDGLDGCRRRQRRADDDRRGHRDPQVWRVCYLLVQTVDTWLVIPGAFAALVSGIALSLVTPWGLTRYWWVLVKLVLTVVVILFST